MTELWSIDRIMAAAMDNPDNASAQRHAFLCMCQMSNEYESLLVAMRKEMATMLQEIQSLTDALSFRHGKDNT